MDEYFNTAAEGGVSSMEEAFAVLEACLFAAGHPLTYSRLGETLGVTPAVCRDIVEKWKPIYNSDTAFPRGIVLVTFPDSCQLCTKENYHSFVKNALGIRRGGNLSQSLLEVLAVVAYNQPATRTFIDTVRGVDSSYAVGALLEKNLIEPCGRLDAPGRPTLYRTTEDFLRVFGLDSLRDLPAVQVRNENGEKVELMPQTESPADVEENV
ncbi:MAG: SMC-Scp complex subunit ScpB [Ruminococcaceae bacterium]|nr:SMC-Scp complex subunit ScpB [Oscillospiraceae bacterium]